MDPLLGELELEELGGAGQAVGAKVSEAGLGPHLHPHPPGAGGVEETLHPLCAGAEAHLTAGQEVTQNNSSSVEYILLNINSDVSVIETSCFQWLLMATVHVPRTEHAKIAKTAITHLFCFENNIFCMAPV